MYCRKPERRVELVEKYIIKPVFYSDIIPGQEKRSCTGDPLTDEYFLFTYTEKDGDHSGTFYCGKYAADHFLELTDSERPPHFNPLKTTSTHSSKAGRGSGGAAGSGKRPFHPASQQLYDAIRLVMVCWNTPPKKPLADIKDKVEKFGHNAPYPREVKGVNSIIKKGGRPLPSMIQSIRNKGHAVRDFRFDLINAILKDEYPSEPSFFE